MRLIDANELKEWVKNWFIKNKYYHPYSKSNDIPINELYDILEQVPTIDAEPVRHGKWIGKPIAGYSTVRCSACGNVFLENNGKWNYCPDCGVKMEIDNEIN